MTTSQKTASAAGTLDVGGDLTVNRLGFGAMRITGPGIWGEPADPDEAKKVLRRAVELHVNFIDTANSYGPDVSETLIAEALYPYPEDLVIATKGGLVRPGPGRWEPDGRPEHLRESCEGSLRRLKLDQIPLYQFHRPDPKVPFAESIGTLVELKDEGKIRHIGVSNVTEGEIRQASKLTPVVSIQNRFNVSDRSSETIVDLCEEEQFVFLPWAPISQSDDNSAVSDAAKAHGVSERQVVLAWMLARSPQILPIPGTGSVEHLESNVAAASIELSARGGRGHNPWYRLEDLADRASLLRGSCRALLRGLLGHSPEIPTSDRSVRSPALTPAFDVLFAGCLARLEGDRETLAYSEVVHREHIGAAQSEHEEHLSCPAPDPAHLDQPPDDLFVVHPLCLAQRRYRSLKSPSCEVLKR